MVGCNSKKIFLIVLLVLSVMAMAHAGDLTFSAKPSVTKDGANFKLSFTLSASSDVEVSVVGADNKVVRHLAAGVLNGKFPPPEPLKPGLAQEVIWDGNDDLGKPVTNGPFKFLILF